MGPVSIWENGGWVVGGGGGGGGGGVTIKHTVTLDSLQVRVCTRFSVMEKQNFPLVDWPV